MSEHLSSWIDSELSGENAVYVLDALSTNETLRRKSEEYWRIGDMLREAFQDEPKLSEGFCDCVMTAIDKQPTVLAPAAIAARTQADKPAVSPQPSSWWLSVAAAGAGVAFVGWMALSFSPHPSTEKVNIANEQSTVTTHSALNTEILASPVSTRVDYAPIQANSELNDDRAYIMAHQPYGGGGDIPTETNYIRAGDNKKQTESQK